MKKKKILEKKIWKLLLVVARRQMASSRLAYGASSLGLSKMERNALAQKLKKISLCIIDQECALWYSSY